MNIGEVLGELQQDFPQVTASKIRFLEEKGLVTPQRTAAGYRKYTDADVDRLRFILALQRDQYLPLKVIKDYLDAVDRGEHPESLPGGLTLSPRSVSDQLAQEIAGHIRPLTRAELQGISGASGDLLDSLEQFGMIQADEDGRYGDHALKAARAAVVLSSHGLEPRHLRPFRAAADREIGLVEQATAAMATRRDAAARARVAEAAREISEACLGLHSALVGAAIADLDT
ncbi:MerR family transcriptional regulator [Micrococcus terreus]|uniref:transcriptional regulator FtsR n=1 Tax=Micrococcus terreus TaxID=574650 RepID=UPI002550E958|nr:MerR family transcriptional regulator [Micrococcus terreus]MDK7701581.1 MerR family transcriptional regulator [Micrococcus terreus]WOO98928.1 MerR family transcriptional regulator [Micrococcus terreus]